LLKKIGPDSTGVVSIQDQTDETLSWITFPKTQIAANPQEWTDVPFTIKIPKSAGYGYYFAVQFVLSNNSSANAKVAGSGAVPILLTVNRPGAKAEGQLVLFNTDSLINEYLPVSFTTMIKSTGNIYIKPHGDIFIRGFGDSEIGTIEVNTAQGAILPGAVRVFNSTWDDGFVVSEPVIDNGRYLTDAKGNVVKHLVIHWDRLTHFRIGKYTASLLMVYDNGKRDAVIESTTSFWVFPYKIFAVFILALIIFLIVIRLLLKWYVRKAIKKAGKK